MNFIWLQKPMKLIKSYGNSRMGNCKDGNSIHVANVGWARGALSTQMIRHLLLMHSCTGKTITFSYTLTRMHAYTSIWALCNTEIHDKSFPEQCNIAELCQPVMFWAQYWGIWNICLYFFAGLKFQMKWMVSMAGYTSGRVFTIQI